MPSNGCGPKRTYHDPSRASVAFESFLPGSQPSLAMQDHFTRHEGAPLADGWDVEVRQAISRIAEDPDEDAAARFAARRALIYFRVR